MVTEVNNLIYNTLIEQRAVLLPDVGTIYIRRVPASMKGKAEVCAPRLIIDFSSSMEAASIVDIISTTAGVSLDDASDIYGRWLDKQRNDNTLTIDGVGTLRNKSFVAEQSLNNALNPNTGRHKLPKRRRLWPLFVVISLLLIAICGIGAYFILSGGVDERKLPDTPKANSASKTTTIEKSVTPSNSDTVTTPEVQEQQPSNQSAVETATLQQETIFEETNDASHPTQWHESDNIRHWVVAGSYSTEKNADRAIANIEKRNADISCACYKLGKMYAVVVFGSADIDECHKFVRSHRQEISQMWIHTPKQYK